MPGCERVWRFDQRGRREAKAEKVLVIRREDNSITPSKLSISRRQDRQGTRQYSG